MTDATPSRLALPSLTLGLSVPVTMIAQRGAELAGRLGLGAVSDRRLKSALDLPVLAHVPADAAAVTVRTQTDALVAAGDWGALHDLIRHWDLARAATPQGQRKARIALRAALSAATPEAFAARAAAAPADPVAATLAARAALHHGPDLTAAAAWLDRFEPAEWASPLLAEAHYLYTAALRDGVSGLHAAHDDWADLDAADAAVWETHALHLAELGSMSALAAAAARAEWQTERWLGRGGYALFLLPVIDTSPALWDRIDPERLAAGMLDLARHRHRDQGAVNRIACAWQRIGHGAPAPLRPLLRTSYRQLLEESLNTLVPAVWGLSELAARRRIADAFAPELRAGACLRATPAGLTLCDRSAR